MLCWVAGVIGVANEIAAPPDTTTATPVSCLPTTPTAAPVTMATASPATDDITAAVVTGANGMDTVVSTPFSVSAPPPRLRIRASLAGTSHSLPFFTAVPFAARLGCSPQPPSQFMIVRQT